MSRPQSIDSNALIAKPDCGVMRAYVSIAVIHRKPSPELPNITRIAYCIRCGHTQNRVNLPGKCIRVGCSGPLSRRHLGSSNRHLRVMTTYRQELKSADGSGELQAGVKLSRAGLAVKSSVVPVVNRVQSADNIGLVG